ncbi:MAG: glycosyltransferase family 4 protein [Acidobacteria bacterium]|nr:glycosyltransferase family 4 protein [Acidobacteriota bacterium]
MHIAIDARELCGRPTGVGRYLSHLLTAWGDMAETRGHRFTLYTPAPIDIQTVAPRARALDLVVQVIGGHPGAIWEQIRLASALRRDRPDVLFAPAYTSPLRCGVPTVLTVHDISFEAHPEWYRWREGTRLRWLTRRAARAARLVLTDSEFSKRELVERMGISANAIRVIRLGVSEPRPSTVRPFDRLGVVPSAVEGGEPQGRPKPSRGTTAPDAGPSTTPGARASQAEREPLVLFVGSLFNRRRLPDLLSAFRDLTRTHPGARLEIVGEDRTYPHQDLAALAVRLGIPERVSLRSYVSDEELVRLYERASVFGFLSEYEGFGLTPLEALAAGVPIVVLDTAVARELYGDAAVYVGRGDVGGTAAALAQLISDADARRRRLDRAAVVLRGFSWSEAARQTLEALEAAHSPKPPSGLPHQAS